MKELMQQKNFISFYKKCSCIAIALFITSCSTPQIRVREKLDLKETCVISYPHIYCVDKDMHVNKIDLDKADSYVCFHDQDTDKLFTHLAKTQEICNQ